MKARIRDFIVAHDRRQILSLELSGDFRDEYDRLKEKDLSVEVKEYREKRSLDANAALWLIVGKIADILRTGKDSVYLEMLKRYGQGGVVKVPSKDIDNFKRTWKYCEEHEKLCPEEKASYFRFWVGSSNYDRREFSVLLDGAISEAKELGIDFISREERDRMLEEWDNA